MIRNDDRLVGVHPELSSVVWKTAERVAYDIIIIEGVRSDERCWENWGKGRTTAQCKAAGVPVKYAKPKDSKVTWLKNPLNSKHRKQEDGFGHAVDIAIEPLDWNNLDNFSKLARDILQTAVSLGIKIRWGGNWDMDEKPHEKGEWDSPHFELVP